MTEYLVSSVHPVDTPTPESAPESLSGPGMATPEHLSVIVQADGGSRYNPGTAGAGAVVIQKGTRDVLGVVNYLFPEAGTNNEAEYVALLIGLQEALDLRAEYVEVEMDSKLVVQQMTGRFKVKGPRLIGLHEKAEILATSFRRISYRWIPREQNRAADWLANEAMDGRPASLPPMLSGGPVVVTTTQPTRQANKPYISKSAGNGLSEVARVELTAALAARNNLTGPLQEIAARLVSEYPDDVTVIWDNLPGERHLFLALNRHPLSWKRGLAQAEPEATAC